MKRNVKRNWASLAKKTVLPLMEFIANTLQLLMGFIAKTFPLLLEFPATIIAILILYKQCPRLLIFSLLVVGAESAGGSGGGSSAGAAIAAAVAVSVAGGIHDRTCSAKKRVLARVSTSPPGGKRSDCSVLGRTNQLGLTYWTGRMHRGLRQDCPPLTRILGSSLTEKGHPV